MKKKHYRHVRFDVQDEGSTMHSHDRTLLSKLGFGDADKSNDRHDLACQYLAAEAGALFGLKGVTCGLLEQPLNKGEDKYKTTIGFVDVCGWVGRQPLSAGERQLLDTAEDYSELSRKEKDAFDAAELKRDGHSFVIEVKIKPIGVGDILRQIALYREYSENLEFLIGSAQDDVRLWGVVADFDLSDGALNALESADVRFARLGVGFEKWLKRARVVSKKRIKTL